MGASLGLLNTPFCSGPFCDTGLVAVCVTLKEVFPDSSDPERLEVSPWQLQNVRSFMSVK